MHHDRIAIAHGGQDLERAPAGDHEVLGDNLEPVHRRMIFEDVNIVGPAQAHAKAQKRKVGALHWIAPRAGIRPARKVPIP